MSNSCIVNENVEPVEYPLQITCCFGESLDIAEIDVTLSTSKPSSRRIRAAALTLSWSCSRALKQL